MYRFDDDMGKKIQICRMAFEVSAVQLSCDIGMNKRYIDRLERGEFKPSMVSFLKICRRFELAPQCFLGVNLEDFERNFKISKELALLDDERRAFAIKILEMCANMR